MDKFDRIFQLDAIFRRRRTAISADDLMVALECSRATLHRMLAFLRDNLKAPIELDHEGGGYRYAPQASDSYELPGMWFSSAELQALVILQRLAKEVGGGMLGEQLGALSRRLNGLTQHKRLNLKEAESRLRFPILAARPIGTDFDTVLSATLQRKQVQLHYHARGSDEHTDRVVSPQRVTHYREAWYLDVWDEQRQDFRSLSIDRISGAQVIERPARHFSEAELDAHFAGAFGIFGGKPDKMAVLVFTAESARWVADEHWHPDKRARFLEDGRYELTIPYRNSQELVMEILRHGPDVAVVSPESLRNEVRQQLTRALQQYIG